MKSDTQSRLVEIATPLFATKGFAAVSVREVTDAAGVNVSAISYHFNGKEGLYQAVLEEQFAPMVRARQSVQKDKLLSPTERLRFYADMVARIHATRPFLARFMSGELNNPTSYGGPIIEKHLSQVYTFLRDALQEGVAKGDFRDDLNISYAAISLAGILNFYFIARPFIKKIISLDEEANAKYAQHAFAIYLQGIIKEK